VGSSGGAGGSVCNLSEVRHRSAASSRAEGYGALGGPLPKMSRVSAPWTGEEFSYDPGPCHTSGEEDGEEASATSLHKFWHRAGWLVLLLMLQSTSSVILEHFEMLVRHHPVIIYFLTMLVGAGGNAGSQSTILVVRRLALSAACGNCSIGTWWISARRIVGAEVSVGARLAAVLFCASVARCILFQVRGVECLAICLSMLAIVFTSTLVGATLPLILSRLGLDPAHAGAAIQVIMDICGVTLTCVISCLVLGMPLNGEEALVADLAIAGDPSAASTVSADARPRAHHARGASGASSSGAAAATMAAVIQTRRGLQAFGGPR